MSYTHAPPAHFIKVSYIISLKLSNYPLNDFRDVSQSLACCGDSTNPIHIERSADAKGMQVRSGRLALWVVSNSRTIDQHASEQGFVEEPPPADDEVPLKKSHLWMCVRCVRLCES